MSRIFLALYGKQKDELTSSIVEVRAGSEAIGFAKMLDALYPEIPCVVLVGNDYEKLAMKYCTKAYIKLDEEFDG